MPHEGAMIEHLLGVGGPFARGLALVLAWCAGGVGG